MRRHMGIAAGFALIALSGSVGNNAAQGTARRSTKEIMNVAMKGGLVQRVTKGTASPAERALLVELFTDLAANTPPQGDANSWRARTGALLAAARSNDPRALAAVSDCKSCHAVHRPN